MTHRTWFSCLVRHPVRKRERVYSYNPDPTRGWWVLKQWAPVMWRVLCEGVRCCRRLWLVNQWKRSLYSRARCCRWKRRWDAPTATLHLRPISISDAVRSVSARHTVTSESCATTTATTTTATFYFVYFSLIALTLLVGQPKGHPVGKKSGVRLLVVTSWLELCTSYSSSCHHPSSLAPIKSRMETFWYRLTWIVVENGH